MNRRWLTLAAGVVLGAIPGATLASPSSSATRVGRCRVTSFTLAQGREVTPPTGYNPLPLVFRNRSATACVLYGHPAFAFIDAQGALPFEFSYAGDQVVTRARPQSVLVRAGGSAYALLDKYRCDRGDRRRAKTVRIAFPGSGLLLTLRLRAVDISWCGPLDPGSTVTVSPFERSLAATRRR